MEKHLLMVKVTASQNSADGELPGDSIWKLNCKVDKILRRRIK
jgi:hypothetical protein